MLVRATVSFAGALVMHAGEVRDVPSSPALDDVLKAGYVAPVENTATAEKKPTTPKKRVGKK